MTLSSWVFLCWLFFYLLGNVLFDLNLFFNFNYSSMLPIYPGEKQWYELPVIFSSWIYTWKVHFFLLYLVHNLCVFVVIHGMKDLFWLSRMKLFKFCFEYNLLPNLFLLEYWKIIHYIIKNLCFIYGNLVWCFAFDPYTSLSDLCSWFDKFDHWSLIIKPILACRLLFVSFFFFFQ